MRTGIIKRSLVMRGHKTSVSLENEFWEGLHDIAKRKNISVQALAELIDDARKTNNLSSAIRVYVFNDFRMRLAPVVEKQMGWSGATRGYEADHS
jgi:predicted DNA-binding ribbon-helix-helix protein